jgi:protein-disulfide isomerase
VTDALPGDGQVIRRQGVGVRRVWWGALAVTVVALGAPVAAQENPRLQVDGLGYVLGSEDAPVRVVEFSDLGCNECRAFALETFPTLLTEFVDSGLVRWRFIPYFSGLQPNGEEGARAVECAAEQDSFWPMHDMVYENQADWYLKRRPQRQFGRYAKALDLDSDAVGDCYKQKITVERTERNTAAALGAGVRATPTFFVNGRMVLGALPIAQFRQLLEAARMEAPR